MNTTSLPQVELTARVDCPLCDGPADLDARADALACPACGIRLEVAADGPAALAEAA